MADASPIDTIRTDFELLDDWEDRYRYLIELGRALPAFPEAERTDANKVRGCASQVWLATHVDRSGGAPRLHILGDSDAHIVKGLIAVLLAVTNDQTATDILKAEPHRLFGELGLAQHLTPQRSNGFASMVARIRTDAEAALGQGS